MRMKLMFSLSFVRVFCLLVLFVTYKIVAITAQESDTLCTMRGVVNISVCNIHAAPDFESPMETQALLGMPVKILAKGRWYQVQTPDGYKAWVHRAAIVPMDSMQLQFWLDGPKVVVTSHSAWVYSKPSMESMPVSDVVSGCMLHLEGEKGKYYKVTYPDGREGFLLKTDAQLLEGWMSSREFNVESLMKTALSLNGIPYMWAGTSSKGVDCSGLVQFSAFLNGVLLPRNASQQACLGKRIDCTQGYSLLRPGDLLLFGKPAAPERGERVIHIGIYLGDGCFIHSQGYVHMSSLNPSAQDYDAFNRARWLGAVRICDEKGIIIAPSIDKIPFYKNQFE